MDRAVMMRKTGCLMRLKSVFPNRVDMEGEAMMFPLKAKNE
jgi:hypothetical protein